MTALRVATIGAGFFSHYPYAGWHRIPGVEIAASCVRANRERAEALAARFGGGPVYTDAEDANFWQGADLSRIEAVVMAMNDLESKLVAARALRARGFRGPIVSQALYEDHVERITAAGADHTHLTFREAGESLARRAVEAVEPRRTDPPTGGLPSSPSS